MEEDLENKLCLKLIELAEIVGLDADKFDDDSAQIAIMFNMLNAIIERLKATPAAQWRENGEDDPHGTYYEECKRADLCLGRLTDDQMANAVYLEPNIANLTGAKERIRWLSRKTEAATACAQRMDKFLKDVLPQVGKLCINDYQNLNELGIAVSKLKVQ